MSIEIRNRVFALEQASAEMQKKVGTLDKEQMLLVYNLMRDELKRLSERVLKLEQKRG